MYIYIFIYTHPRIRFGTSCLKSAIAFVTPVCIGYLAAAMANDDSEDEGLSWPAISEEGMADLLELLAEIPVGGDQTLRAPPPPPEIVRLREEAALAARHDDISAHCHHIIAHPSPSRSRSRSPIDELIPLSAALSEECDAISLIKWDEHIGKWLHGVQLMGTAHRWSQLLEGTQDRLERALDSVPANEPYYVGLSGDIVRRWKGWYQRVKIGDVEEWKWVPGHDQKWRSMFVLTFHDGPIIRRLERAMIDRHISVPRNTNKSKGGERAGPSGTLSFVYVVTRAIDVA
jgi:hypothetical protein